MFSKVLHHATGFRRCTLVVAMALMASLAALSAAAPALATPKGEFAVFANCPLTSPELKACLIAKTESGQFTVGKVTVPIKNAITLQGGFSENEETGALNFVGAADGNTLSKTGQPVPGGLAGLVNCPEISNWFERITCELVFEHRL